MAMLNVTPDACDVFFALTRQCKDTVGGNTDRQGDRQTGSLQSQANWTLKNTQSIYEATVKEWETVQCNNVLRQLTTVSGRKQWHVICVQYNVCVNRCNLHLLWMHWIEGVKQAHQNRLYYYYESTMSSSVQLGHSSLRLPVLKSSKKKPYSHLQTKYLLNTTVRCIEQLSSTRTPYTG